MAAGMYQTLISAQGFIPLPLMSWRAIASNDIPALAGTPASGILASDTSPKLIRVNTSTDKALRIIWSSSTSIEICNHIFYPPDMDATATYTVNCRIGKNTNTDATCTFTVGVFEGVGDTTRGSATAVLGAAAVTAYTCTVTPTAGHPNFAALSLVPGTHTTDDIWLYEAYVLYQKKLLTS